MRKNKWLSLVVGIVALGLLLTGCTESSSTTGAWDVEAGNLEASIEDIREIVLANTSELQELRQQVGSLNTVVPSGNAETGSPEDIARLDNSLASLQRSFDTLSARVAEISTTLSERTSGTRPAGGRP